MRIIFSLVIVFILMGCNSGEQEIIVVPKDFSGYIIVLFNQKDGTAPIYEGNKRIYEIPKSGILRTQFESNYGMREFAEFYYEKISPETRIPSFVELKSVPSDKIVGLIGANGTVKKSAKSEDRIEFVEFYIGTKKTIEQAQEQVEKLDITKLAE
jgi:Family of unknown function (DUF6843)